MRCPPRPGTLRQATNHNAASCRKTGCVLVAASRTGYVLVIGCGTGFIRVNRSTCAHLSPPSEPFGHACRDVPASASRLVAVRERNSFARACRGQPLSLILEARHGWSPETRLPRLRALERFRVRWLAGLSVRKALTPLRRRFGRSPSKRWSGPGALPGGEGRGALHSAGMSPSVSQGALLYLDFDGVLHPDAFG